MQISNSKGEKENRAAVMFATAAGILAFGSTATGFVIGWALALLIDRTNNGSVPKALADSNAVHGSLKQ